MKPEEILSIKEPGHLFPREALEIKKRFRELAKEWHPDVSHDPKATEVFEHLNRLKQLALTPTAVWEERGRVEIDCGITSRIYPYLRRHDFELGQIYVCQHNVVTILSEQVGLWGSVSSVKLMTGFKYPNEKMRDEISKCLPQGRELHNLKGNRQLVVVNKDPELILLRDVMSYYGGKLDPRHVAWIMSTLYNLSCYFAYARIVHNDISPDTYYINPKTHSGALLGGWWYALESGDRLKVVPLRTFKHLPWKCKKNKVASRLTNLELIRQTGRELLGERSAAPIMWDWLTLPAMSSAVTEYEEWGKVLNKQFGARRFTEMKLTPNDIYGGI